MNTQATLAADEWTAPGHVEIRGAFLLWSYHGSGRVPRKRTAEPGLLEEFFRLAEAPDTMLAQFARRHGALYICRHDRPSSHRQTGHPTGRRGLFARCELREIRSGVYAEPLIAWRRYATQLRSLVRIAEEIHTRRTGGAQDWRVVLGIGTPKRVFVPESVSDARLFLGILVNELLREALVQPQFSWGSKGAAVTFGNRTVFGALVAELLLMVSRTRGLAICSGCGSPYLPNRLPPPDRRHYCRSCGRKVATLDAVNDYRRRKKEARCLHKEGCSLGEIARRLGRDPKMIEKWVS